MATVYLPKGVNIIKDARGNISANNTTGKEYLIYEGDTVIDTVNGGHFKAVAPYTIHFWKTQTAYHIVTSLFKYLETDITSPVSDHVENLVLKRNSGYNFSLSWTNPTSMTSSDRNDRATTIYVYIKLKYKGTVVSSDYYFYNSLITSWSKTILKTSESSSDATWDRKGFYPYTSKMIDEIRFEVVPKNTRGANSLASRAVSYRFSSPNPPKETGTYKVDKSTGVVSLSMSSPIDNNTERDMVYTSTWVDISSTISGKYSETTTSKVKRTDSSFTITQVLPNRHTLSAGDVVSMYFYACASGICGDAKASRRIQFWIPSKPSISIASVSQDWATGNVVVGTKPVARYYENPTMIQLQALLSTPYQDAESIPTTAAWINVGPLEQSPCEAISLSILSLLPLGGTVTWIRMKQWFDIEEIFYSYSEPLRLRGLETPAPVIPSAEDDMADILSYTVNAGGTSVDVLIGWDDDGEDDSNRTEISWSTNEKSWRSTKSPDTFVLDDDEWDEGPVTVGSKTYNKSTHVTIVGLEENTRYYMTCRRILQVEKSDASYGPYSTKKIVDTSDVTALPETVTAYVDESIIAGEPIQVSWGYNSPLEQSSWMIKQAVNGGDYSDNDIVLASNNDPRHAYKLPYYRGRGDTQPIVSEDENNISLYVVVTVSSVTLTSEIININILRRPEFDIIAPSSTIVQPVSLAVFSDNKRATVSAFIEAQGVISSGPSGAIEQSDGDTVWSGTISPQWELIDEYAEDANVQQAKQDLDDAQEAYDTVLEQYTDATSRRDDASARIETLTVGISNAQRDIPTAQTTLQDAQDRLDGADEDDPMYELYVTQVQEAQERLQELQSGLQADTTALSVAESDLQTALDDIDSIDMSEEEGALREAIDAYATAEAEAIDPTSDVLAYKALIILPDGLTLVDGARYLVHGFATDTQSGVNSDERLTEINIAWAHQSPIPSEDIAISPIDQIDDRGIRTIGAGITLERPVNAFDTDVYDVYRITKGGIFLAAKDIPLECTLLDKYATFSGEPMQYRIACRTQDGDVVWNDYTYLLQESDETFRSAIRIDWNGNYVELERNVVPSDSYEKPFTAHTHLDGTVSGHWNEGTRRTMSVQAALVRTYDNTQREAIEGLARYDGPCYVRTNDGVAFECNVQVDSINLNRNSIRIDISLTMTEIEPTGTFLAVVEE